MQWNQIRFFYDLETKIKACISDHPVKKILEIGQFLSEQRAFENKQLFLGLLGTQCICK